MPDDLLLAVIGPEPHPALVAAQVPDTRTMLLAICVLGWLPEDRWEPAVRA